MSNTEEKINLFSKAFWKTRQGQRLFCVIGLAISVLFLLWQFGGSLLGGMPGAGSRKILEQDLKKLQQEELRLKAELAELNAFSQAAAQKLVGAWKAAENGEPEVELRSLIENTAKNMELRLNNISMVRRSSFNKDISLLELDVSLTSDLDTLMKFLLAVDQLQPQLYWKKFECRASNMFGMSAVQFNGTLRCANDERPEAAAQKTAAPGTAEAPAGQTVAAPAPEQGGQE
ncbi:MAG: hypothetical protein E7052_05200 [Lentisphaerae bacterium]|nr:hypothetical protein [Lentisphaerota bacterium]